jgi:hypothetical protein
MAPELSRTTLTYAIAKNSREKNACLTITSTKRRVGRERLTLTDCGGFPSHGYVVSLGNGFVVAAFCFVLDASAIEAEVAAGSPRRRRNVALMTPRSVRKFKPGPWASGISPRQTDWVSGRLGTRLRLPGPGHEGSRCPPRPPPSQSASRCWQPIIANRPTFASAWPNKRSILTTRNGFVSLRNGRGSRDRPS